MKILSAKLRLLWIITLCLVTGSLIYTFYRKIPAAQHVTTQQPVTIHTPKFTVIESSPLPQKSNSTIWGKVTTKDGKPLVGVIIYIGQQGVKTGQDGSYVISLQEEGTQMVSFHNLATNERYQIANSFEPVLYLTKRENLHQDFVVEKVK